MQYQLGKLGETGVARPTSLATCLDFVSIWASEPNRAVLGRICAGAIGVCSQSNRLPSYRPANGDPVGYGHVIMERLLEANVSPSEIYEIGAKCLTMMASAIPTKNEVETTADFLPQTEDG